MKKITSVLLALFSTLFLAVGATHAAEKFDPTDRTNIKKANFSDTVMDGPISPCGTILN